MASNRSVPISYRWTSGAVLFWFALQIAVGMLFPNSLRKPASEVTWDPCSMWSQMPLTEKLPNEVWFVTFAILLVQGLRNRPVPWALALVSLIALGFVIRNLWWWESRCDSPQGIVSSGVWFATVAVMCLHQMLQRPKAPATGVHP
jgi:hypothetical protein